MTAVTGQALDDIMAGAVNLIVQDNMGREPELAAKTPLATVKETPAVQAADVDAVAMEQLAKPIDRTFN